MSMINCPTCKKQIAEDAQPCPKCGHPLTDEERKSAIAFSRKFNKGCLWVVVVIIALIAIGSLSGEKDKNPAPGQEAKQSDSKPREIVSNSPWDGSVRQVERYLKDNLKDPDSYQGIEWSPVRKEGQGFIVRHKYRAKNSYGGYVMDNQVFYLDAAGNVVKVMEY